MKLRWLLTAAFEIITDNYKILIDPWILRPPTAEQQLKTKISDIQGADAIFLSHGHYDHSLDVPEIVEGTDTKVYCSEQIKEVFLKDLGVSEENIKGIQPSQIIEFQPDFKVTVIKSQHIEFDENTLKRLESVRQDNIVATPKFRFADLEKYVVGDVFGYLFEFSNGKKLVHFGSGGYYEEELRKLPTNIDIFLAPIAGREDVEEVVAKMACVFNPKMIIPHHYDDFIPPFSVYAYQNFDKEVKKLNPNIIINKLNPEIYYDF
jgi:L-ascorbate metabolism protein UlaG (beta-lactamase superfamily)